MKLTKLIALGSLALGLISQTARADEYLYGYSQGNNTNNLTVDGSTVLYSGANQGWWSPTSGNYNNNDNYIVGNYGGTAWNDYFMFDISDLTGSVTSASLNLMAFGAYSSTSSSLLFSLFDVSTDVASLMNKDAGPSAAIYNDLGSGVNYGSVVVSTSIGYYDTVTVQLNAAGVAALNSAIAGDAQYFKIGGTVSPSNSVPDTTSSLALFGCAAAALVALRRKLA